MHEFLFLACAQCANDRAMSGWFIFVVLRLLCIMAVAQGRLDPVRILGLFVLFEVGYLFAWRMLMFYSYGNSHLPDWTEKASMIGFLLLVCGVPAIALIWCASHLRYFRAQEEVRLSLRRCLWLIPSFFALSFLQSV